MHKTATVPEYSTKTEERTRTGLHGIMSEQRFLRALAGSKATEEKHVSSTSERSVLSSAHSRSRRPASRRWSSMYDCQHKTRSVKHSGPFKKRKLPIFLHHERTEMSYIMEWN